MAMSEGPHKDLLLRAIATEQRGHRALVAGEGPAAAAEAMREAAALYRASWDVAPPASFGRLVGALKAAVIAGDATAEARYALSALADDDTSPPAAYARAIATLVLGQDGDARAATTFMRIASSEAFGRAADAIDALAGGDEGAYATAVAAIVADFEHREEHLTGVPIADTAVMLERLAASRGLHAGVRSPLLPAA
jgi:hypothetical protein